MRTIPAPLAAHLASGVTTLCHCWRLTRRDGAVMGFTDHDRRLTFAGTDFLAASGFAASEREEEAGLSAATSEVAGGFSSEAIREADLAAGLYDGARVELFLVNWTAPSQNLLLKVEDVGEVTRAGGEFRAELRALAHRLSQPQGRVYARRCDATLGDARCGVSVAGGTFRATGMVTAVTDESRLRVNGLSGFAAGFFRHGRLTFTDGVLAGTIAEIDGQDGAALRLWLPLAALPAVGDGVMVTAGCDGSFATCRAKFANSANFRGFPHMPGADFAYSYADGETVHDGGVLFE
ncbi:DUF2163 domain-containing protein [Allorhizobium borbori]|uniref:Putative phage protein (TIGR02218 family) n=1 Tax=Allorhizobium borbori TaxID=485907 RepID=A0A7W6K6E7_9HYPH|nr:DUF2163 domain-containing protein [Allorhizobium borbori]MBB4104852.1 putative phage protein (TIGR02218 family) [Allorhizobium borbori]